MMTTNVSPEIKKQINEDIASLYEDLAKEMSQLSSPCTACGFCCNFNAAEHFLYASTLEIMYIFDKYQLDSTIINKNVCPFLKNNMCSIRDRRMLGCRTYFSKHTKEEVIAAEEIHGRYIEKFDKLHQKYQIERDYQDCMNVFVKKSTGKRVNAP